MKIDKYKFALADKVLAALRRIPSAYDGWVTAYSNGREQGYVLHVFLRGPNLPTELAVTFSENRNSDDVVVYPIDMTKMMERTDKEGEKLADEAWRTRKLFQSVQDAAQHVLRTLKAQESKAADVHRAKALERYNLARGRKAGGQFTVRG